MSRAAGGGTETLDEVCRKAQLCHRTARPKHRLQACSRERTDRAGSRTPLIRRRAVPRRDAPSRRWRGPRVVPDNALTSSESGVVSGTACFWQGERKPLGQREREPRCSIREGHGHRHRFMIGNGNGSHPYRVTSGGAVGGGSVRGNDAVGSVSWRSRPLLACVPDRRGSEGPGPSGDSTPRLRRPR
jgi:hypothetical protein